jgi:Methyltransferase domain
MTWRRRLLRLADLTQLRLQPVLDRSHLAERAWVRIIDAVVARQTDRGYFRRSILPAIRSAGFRKVLFIGVRGYTRSYDWWFRKAGIEFWTSDIDPAAARYGARDRHAVADVRDLDKTFLPGSFDLVILNGVFGWGVDEPQGMAQTLHGIAHVLEDGGMLLVGWNHDRS